MGKEGAYCISSLCRTASLPVWINGKKKENKYPEYSSNFFFPFLLKNALQNIKISIIFLACQL